MQANAVSIHAPREGCDLTPRKVTELANTFQFTHPGRGATWKDITARTIPTAFQFTHPGRGATGRTLPPDLVQRMFQFTHPGRGATYYRRQFSQTESLFQFTHPGRGATYSAASFGCCCCSFNSRTPGGVRLLTLITIITMAQFQFTHPGRGATYSSDGLINVPTSVSIHAPREGCDLPHVCDEEEHISVSIHAPREGCDTPSILSTPTASEFQFTHPGRGATFACPYKQKTL